LCSFKEFKYIGGGFMEDRLFVLWTNPDLDTAEKMVFMYTQNAKVRKWWDEVTLIIWGGTTKLVFENKKIQEHIKDMIKSGVFVSACRACAEQLGAVDTLLKLGVEVKYWGEPLTKLLKDNEKLVTI
jgi:hypothetical protein